MWKSGRQIAAARHEYNESQCLPTSSDLEFGNVQLRFYMSEDNYQESKSIGVYWSLKDIPELAALSARQKRRVHAQCVRSHFLFAPLTRRGAFAYGALTLSVAVFTALGSYVPKLINVQSSIWPIICGTALGAWLGTFLFSHIAIPSVRSFYRETIKKDLAKKGSVEG